MPRLGLDSDWSAGAFMGLVPVGQFLYRNTSYIEMKSLWAEWPTKCDIRPALPPEIAVEELRSRVASERERTIKESGLGELASDNEITKRAITKQEQEQCIKCDRFQKLFIANRVCLECSESLDEIFRECTESDWMLIGVSARVWGSPLQPVGRFLHRKTSYSEMKLRWEEWPFTCDIRLATPNEVDVEEARLREASELERSLREAARRQMELDKEKQIALDKENANSDEAKKVQGRWLQREKQIAQYKEKAKADDGMRLQEGLISFVFLALAFAAIIAIPIGLIYLLVRFVKWAWAN